MPTTNEVVATLDKTPGAKVVATPARGRTNPTPRILVVEDDAVIRQLNAKVLVGSGYQVAAAEDGAAGWEALYAKDFDLLMTDRSGAGQEGPFRAHDPAGVGLHPIAKVRPIA